MNYHQVYHGDETDVKRNNMVVDIGYCHRKRLWYVLLWFFI